MNTMTQETQVVPIARSLGRCAGKAFPASRSTKILTVGIATGLLALVGMVAFASGNSTPKPPKRAAESTIKVADVVQQQGPRSHQMVPFTVTKSGMVKIEINVSYGGEADLVVVPGWQRANVYATLTNPLFGPGYQYCFQVNDLEGAKEILRHFEAGEYCAVLLNKNWLNGIETRTVVTQNPKF